MSFLAPLFLLGALAVAGPILFHLIRRTTRERRPFSTLMFLQPTPPRVQRRSRLEHVFLLVLRCLVLALLAVGFARPFLQKALPARQSAGEARRVVILVDRSASMRRENLWLQAQEAARDVLRELGPGDRAAVVAFDRELRPIVTFEQWGALPLEGRVGRCMEAWRAWSPGWAATHLGEALLEAAEMLEEPVPGQDALLPGRRQVVVISDFTAGSRLAGLQGYEWREGIEVVLKPLRVRQPTNAGLQPALEAQEAEGAVAGEGVRVRVGNSSESVRELFRVGWERPARPGELEGEVEVYLPPGSSQVIRVPEPKSGGPWTKLVLRGDDHDFDNAGYVTPVDPQQLPVLYLGQESESDPGQPFFYLRRAFQSTRRQDIEVRLQHPGAVPESGGLEEAALVIVADVLPETLRERLRSYVAGGRTALVLVKTPGVALSLGSWPELSGLRCEEGEVPRFLLLGRIDFQHPIFLPFADARYSDFSKIHFWKYRRIPVEDLPAAQALAAFDNGAPALISAQVGRGTLLILTSAWHPAESQLALSSKFVPLLYSVLQQSTGVPVDPGRFAVGDPVRLAGKTGTGPVRVLRPDNSETVVKEASGLFTGTELPGLYQVIGPGWTQSFAVNLDVAESKTAPLPAEEIEQLGVPLARAEARAPARHREQAAARQAAELENRQKLWRWLIIAALGVVLVETWLAGWLSRSRPTAERSEGAA